MTEIRGLEIASYLKQNVGGKEFKGYCWSWDIIDGVTKFLSSKGIDTKDFKFQEKRYYKQTLFILYKGFEIGYIDCKKSRGKLQRGYFGSHSYEWTYSDFSVNFYQNNSLADTLYVAENRYLDQVAYQHRLEDNALRTYDKLIAEYGKSEALKVIEYINKNHYSLDDKIDSLKDL